MPAAQCLATRPVGRRVLNGARRPAEPGSAGRERVAGCGTALVAGLIVMAALLVFQLRTAGARA